MASSYCLASHSWCNACSAINCVNFSLPKHIWLFLRKWGVALRLKTLTSKRWTTAWFGGTMWYPHWAQTEAFTGINWWTPLPMTIMTQPRDWRPKKTMTKARWTAPWRRPSTRNWVVQKLGTPWYTLVHPKIAKNWRKNHDLHGFEMMYDDVRHPTFGEPMINPHFAHFIVTTMIFSGVPFPDKVPFPGFGPVAHKWKI